MPAVLRFGSRGDDVKLLQKALAAKGFQPGPVDGIFGHATAAALIGFQRSEGLLADAIAGPRTWRLLGFDPSKSPSDISLDQINLDLVAEMFPYTRLDTIAEHLPKILQSLEEYHLVEKPMILVALATIRAETETFEPISELPSRFNTSPGGHLFDLYDNRRDLGNLGAPDGERFRGRGFIQLTGRANYGAVGRYVGLGDGLLRDPDRGNSPKIAADILAAFLSMRRVSIKRAIMDGDWHRVRRLVNGGSHGLDRFMAAIEIGDQLLDDPVWLPGQMPKLFRQLPA